MKEAKEQISFGEALDLDEETAPHLSELTADACGERLHHLLPKLKDDQLATLNKNLDEFFELETSEDSDVSTEVAPDEFVVPQLQFSIKAEIVFRMMRQSMGNSDADEINKFTKHQLVVMSDLISTLKEMARPGAPKGVFLPGTSLAWNRLEKLEELVASRLDPILMTETANRRVADARQRLAGNDRGALLRLKTSVEFLIKTGASPTDRSLLQLKKDVTARIKVVEQGKTYTQITPEMLKGKTGAFQARELPPAELMQLMRKLLAMDRLTLDLEFVKDDVEAILNMNKSNAAADFQDAFNDALQAAGSTKSTETLLKLLFVAEKSLASFQASNWDLNGAGLSDWIGEKVRAPKPAAKPNSGDALGKPTVASRLASKVMGSKPVPVEAPVPLYRDDIGMATLRDHLVHGEGRLIRDLLAANGERGATVAHMDELRETLEILLDGNSQPLAPRAANAADLTFAGLTALQTTLNLTVDEGQLVQYSAGGNPVAKTAQKPLPQKT
ncbi:hypothetical protein [Hydrogenophaga sp.]|uniref:hypothetical protein n=1 Tax=Hydrogenophaga sp. TaxID=1904254 RepID=UPI002724D0CA|nr:hypothetical protein [Hydrogenophaga sp.]MDO9434725.1 hypothetical protein [Hydrogenophaga sp.]